MDANTILNLAAEHVCSGVASVFGCQDSLNLGGITVISLACTKPSCPVSRAKKMADQPSPMHVKRFKTLNVWAAFFLMGGAVAILGPTLLDLKIAVQASLTETGYSVSARALGYLAGATLGGIIPSGVRKEHALAVGLLASSALTTYIPWSRSKYSLIPVVGSSGVSMGIVEVFANVYVFDLWKDDIANAKTLAQINYLFYGLGALFGPFLARPFLLPQERNDAVEFENATAAQNNTSESVQIQYPYGVLAALMLLVATSFALSSLIHEASSKIEESPKQGDQNLTDFTKPSSVCVITIGTIFIHLSVGLQLVYGTMLVPYLVQGGPQLSKDTAVLMMSAFWLLFTFFRILPILLLKRVSPFQFLLIEMVFLVIGNIVLLSFDQVSLWVGISLVGLGSSSNWGLTLAYIHEYVELTSRVVSMFCVAAYVGELLYPIMVAACVETMPGVFLVISFACTILMCLTLMCLAFVCHKFFHGSTKTAV